MTKLNPKISIPVRNHQELILAIDSINVALQNIHDYIKDKPEEKAKIRFPRGYLSSIHQHSSGYSWLLDPVLSKNIAYQYVFVDTLRWLANHTDLFSSARDMVLKNLLIGYGTILEALLYGAVKQMSFPEGKVPTRLNRLLKEKIISNALHADLTWLWEIRQSIHIQIIDELERERYSVAMVNKSYKTVFKLQEALRLHFIRADFI